MSMGILLPSLFVLESGGKYLSDVTSNKLESSLPSAGFLKFNEEEIWSPRVKFAAEPAAEDTAGDGTLVHIRSCYNNKYLVTQQIGNDLWIVASAKKPEEDRTKASCTLFEPHSLSSSEVTLSSVCLRHVQTQISATLMLCADGDMKIQQGMLISPDGATSGFRAIDSKSLMVLPTLVSFKTDEKEAKYLGSRKLDPTPPPAIRGYMGLFPIVPSSLYNTAGSDGWPYQRFEDGYDIEDKRVAKKLFPTADGYYRIKDLYFDKFWRRTSTDWIWADAGSDDSSNDTLFSVVNVDNDENVIALKNLGNNYFCGPITKEGKTNCLNANYPNQTKLVIQEHVLKRKISELKYRLSDSRIYGEQNIECDHVFATNDSTDEKSTVTLNCCITDAKTSSWSNTMSIKFGGKTIFETEKIPFIGSGKVELSAEVGYTRVWGGSTVDTFKRESTYSVIVPKLTTMKVTMISTRATCDVPFYYTQTDLLPSGEWVSTVKDDGIFTGMNSYNFRFKSEVVRPEND